MIYVVATLVLEPGSLEAFAEIAIPAIAAARAEPGCRLFDLHASITDPERVVFIEQWDSRAAYDAHFNAPHLATFRAAAGSYVVTAQVEIIHPESVDVL